MDEDDIERRTVMAERLIRLETESEYIKSGIDDIKKTIHDESKSSRKIDERIIGLVSTIGVVGREIVSIKDSLRRVESNLTLKANEDTVKKLEERTESVEKKAQESSFVLSAINWTLKTFGVAGIAGFLYWLATGDMPGG